MLNKTDEIYARVMEDLPPLERLRLVSLVLRNFLEQNNIVLTEIKVEENFKEQFSFSLLESIAEGIEDYCLNLAMDEAAKTPLLDRESALKFLEQDLDEG